MKKIKFNSLIPELSVSDLAKSIKFYVDLLGFKLEYKRNEDKFIFLSFGEVQLMLEQTNEYWKAGIPEYPFGRGINFMFKIDDISELFNKLQKNEYPIFVNSEENWYRVDSYYCGFKEFLILDPDGYVLRFSEEIGIKEVVHNESN